MSQTLYRKYRPQTFNELIGQNHIRLTLENEIKNQRISHAYLFTGPRGVGKTTTARILAKAVNCEKRNKAEPCNVCLSCREITNGNSLDTMEIDAASHTQVENVRENIIPNTRTAPTKNKYKVFIIDEAHMLSLSAFNALLKILEEPPAHVIFILATTEVHKLPETIISRCQRLDFKRVAALEIKDCLARIAKEEKIEVADKVLEIISLMGDGSMRDAESILGQVFSLGEKKITLEVAELLLPRSDFLMIFGLWQKLVNKETKEAIELINRLVEEGVDLKYFCRQFIDFLRGAILTKIDQNLGVYSYFQIDKNQKEEFFALLEKTSENDLRQMIEEFVRRQREIDLTPIPQLPLELAVIKLSGLEKAIPRQPSKVNPKELTLGREEPAKPVIESGEDLKEIENKWVEMVKSLNHQNHSLALVLKNCRPISLNGQNLTIGCNFSFHQERLSDRKNLEKVEKIIHEVIKKKLKIKFIVSPAVSDGSQSAEEDGKEKNINDVLEAFSGEVVDK